MNKIQLITDGAADITPEELKEKNIINVPFYIIDSESTEEKLLTNDELYKNMLTSSKRRYKTACPSIAAYYDIFKDCIMRDEAVICVTISAEFSGSFSSAISAQKMALSEFPNAQIAIVDSMMNTTGQGLFVLEISKMIEQGLEFSEILGSAEKIKLFGKTMFTVESINYLQAGGRISTVKSLIAKTLSLKPIIILEDGVLKSGGFSIGLIRTLVKILDMAKSYFVTKKEKYEDYSFAVGFSCNKPIGEKLLEMCKSFFSIENIQLRQIGCTAGVHTGPNTIGLAFVKKAF